MDKEQLLKYIQEKVKISEDEFGTFTHYFDTFLVKKKSNLIVEEKPNDRIYFIEKGLLYV